jgi:hypothetical protein
MRDYAATVKTRQRAREAEVFDVIADQIEAGKLRIRGASPGPVRDRLRDKARRSRAGERVYNRRSRSSRPDPSDDDAVASAIESQSVPMEDVADFRIEQL